jgi:sulfur relay protein TusD/DsrE
VNILVIVTTSPWGSSLGATALRFVEAAVAAGDSVPAIFFHEDGVYQSHRGATSEGSLPDPCLAWQEFAGRAGSRLLLCQASARRRLQGGDQGQDQGPRDSGQTVAEEVSEQVAPHFSEAGLVEILDMVCSADRVITF